MKTVQCPCGVVIASETDEELVAKVNEHLEDEHPDLAGTYSPEEILFVAF